jgi:hypothetical protein
VPFFFADSIARASINAYRVFAERTRQEVTEYGPIVADCGEATIAGAVVSGFTAHRHVQLAVFVEEATRP